MVHTYNTMDCYFAILTIICCASQVLCQQAAQPPQENNSPRIIGGTATTIERYPFTVQVYELDSMICGGTIVSRRCVLTAAHCFDSTYSSNRPNPADYSVRIGTEYYGSGGAEHKVSRIIVHPKYNRNTIDSDLAMLVLTSNVTTSPRVQPASLAAYDVPDNAEVTIVGWGRTSYGPFAAVLQEVRVRTVSRWQCSQQYQPLKLTITNNMFCAGLLHQGGADACQGDSGGPVLYNGALVGVTSWGEGCGLPSYPGVKVRLSQYLKWIVDTATQHNSGQTLGGLSATTLTLSLLASLKHYYY